MNQINGTHILFYSTNAEADRAFLRDVLGLKHVDAGHGWLIFAMPPAEAALHPADEDNAPRADGRMFGADIYFMCDDIKATVSALEAKKVKCAPLAKERWGVRTAITLPSGGQIGLYQPTHPTALHLK
jgi:catechol 2,3-dioxygenase-like lactoylglutathione lyase family enzyme